MNALVGYFLRRPNPGTHVWKVQGKGVGKGSGSSTNADRSNNANGSKPTTNNNRSANSNGASSTNASFANVKFAHAKAFQRPDGQSALRLFADDWFTDKAGVLVTSQVDGCRRLLDIRIETPEQLSGICS